MADPSQCFVDSAGIIKTLIQATTEVQISDSHQKEIDQSVAALQQNRAQMKAVIDSLLSAGVTKDVGNRMKQLFNVISRAFLDISQGFIVSKNNPVSMSEPLKVLESKCMQLGGCVKDQMRPTVVAKTAEGYQSVAEATQEPPEPAVKVTMEAPYNDLAALVVDSPKVPRKRVVIDPDSGYAIFRRAGTAETQKNLDVDSGAEDPYSTVDIRDVDKKSEPEYDDPAYAEVVVREYANGYQQPQDAIGNKKSGEPDYAAPYATIGGGGGTAEDISDAQVEFPGYTQVNKSRKKDEPPPLGPRPSKPLSHQPS